MNKNYDPKYTFVRPKVIFGDKSKNPAKNGVVTNPKACDWNGIQGAKRISEKDYTGRRS